MGTTHFSGISNASRNSTLAAMGALDPTKFLTFWDDFIHEPLSTEWTITATSAGSGTSAISTPDVHGGQARITTAANENDGIYAQTIGEVFLMDSSKKTWLKTRFQVGDATQSDLIVGLHSTDTTPHDATMRFLFESVDGSAALYFNNDDNTTDSDSSTVATLADDTFVIVGAYYDGAGNIKLYLNDTHVTTMTSMTPPGAEMAVGFGYINGAAGAETTDFDYLFIAQER
jgi:hypothetical protein|tara:strand:- start:2719 stop:3408 length:690 start_codon:yes stop_codon:yes gene_type:complete